MLSLCAFSGREGRSWGQAVRCPCGSQPSSKVWMSVSRCPVIGLRIAIIPLAIASLGRLRTSSQGDE
jgi:hypothetical protein